MNDLHTIQQFVFTLAPLTLIASMILGMISTLGGLALKLAEIKARHRNGRQARGKQNDPPAAGTSPGNALPGNVLPGNDPSLAPTSSPPHPPSTGAGWSIALFE